MRLDAESSRDLDPGHARVGEIEQRGSLRADAARTDIAHLIAQDLVAAVGEDQHDDIEVLVGDRPQRLRRVQSAAVALQDDDLAVRAGDGCADGVR